MCVLSRLIAVGDTVAEDEVVCEIETDKVKEENGTELVFYRDIMTIIIPDYVVKASCRVCMQTSVQVPSPATGVIEELLVPDGGRVEGGTPLFKLRKGGWCMTVCSLHLNSFPGPLLCAYLSNIARAKIRLY